MYSIKPFFLVLLTCSITSAYFESQARLFSKSKAIGSYIKLSAPSLDLEEQGFDDTAQSVNFTGVFIFYGGRSFNKEKDAEVEWGFGTSPGKVLDFNQVSKKLSSVNIAGLVEDYTYSTFTFYEFDYFQGAEEYLNFDASVLNLEGRTASFIITGTGAWTVYDQRNFAGNAICVYPPTSDNFTPGFLPDTSTAGIAQNAIRSVRKGCLSTKIFTIEASTYGSRPAGVPSLRY